ncbi:MAG: D-2-hydroxyacid dehydrogenase family protein [Limnobacter sp.]|nr:D-2-hydroxyacid dehydrogenase family protein [Limnobacter sp.]
MSKQKVVVLDDYEMAFKSAFETGLETSKGAQTDWSEVAALADVKIYTEKLSGDTLFAALEDADAIVLMRDRTPFKADLIAKLPRLKFVMFTGTRNAALDTDALHARNIPICHTEWGPSKDSTAELTWALIMAAHKRVVEQNKLLMNGAWRDGNSLLPVLKGETLGVVGLGEIGGRVARFGQAFGMKVLTWSPNMTAARANAAGAEFVELDELLQRSKIVSLHLVPAATTKGLMNAERLALMRKDSILVNTSRSALVVTADLVDALHKGIIGQAALDVYDAEPLPSGDALRACPNLLLTPHLGFIAGPVIEAFTSGVAEGLAAWLKGEGLVRVLG